MKLRETTDQEGSKSRRVPLPFVVPRGRPSLPLPLPLPALRPLPGALPFALALRPQAAIGYQRSRGKAKMRE